MAQQKAYFVGVDVGTGSARAALVAADGQVEQQAVEAIKTWTPEPHYYEQSSEDIWNAICRAVKVISKTSADNPRRRETIRLD